MGKFEVLSHLQMLRRCGDDRFFRHCEIHEEMRRNGQSFNFSSVWRCINSLYSDGLLEVDIDHHGLQRTARFRARMENNFFSYQIVNNNLPAKSENRRCAVSEKRIDVRRKERVELNG